MGRQTHRLRLAAQAVRVFRAGLGNVRSYVGLPPTKRRNFPTIPAPRNVVTNGHIPCFCTSKRMARRFAGDHARDRGQ